MNFSQIKEIIIPEGSVKKIMSGSVVLWQKVTELIKEFLGYPLNIVYALAGNLINWKLYGNSVQEETPTPDVPVEIKSVGDILPAGYTQLESIECTGTQYINTGINPNNNTKITAYFKSTNISSTNALLGARNEGSGSERNSFSIWENVGNHMRFDYQSSQIGEGEISTTDWNYVVKDNIHNYLNGTELGSSTEATFTCNYPIVINAVNTKGSIGSISRNTFGIVEIYQDGTTLSFKGIPAKRNSDNKVGMFDLVSNTFCPNAGTGSFIAGNPSYQIPVTVSDGTNVLDKYGIVQPNVMYEVNYSGITFVASCANTGTVRFRWYDENKEQMNYYTLSDVDTTLNRKYKHANFTNTKVTKYVMFSSTDGSDFKLEVGVTTPTKYVAPSLTQIYLNAPLRKVGTYADYIDYENQQVVRNVGYRVLDGTENINVTNVYIKSDACNGYYLARDMYSIHYTQSTPGYCSHFVYTKSAPIWQTVGYPNMFQFNSQQIHLNIANELLGITDYTQETIISVTTKIKAYLASQYANGTPVIIVYPLATQTTESLTVPALTMAKGTNVIVCDCTISPSDMYGKGYVSQL